MNYKMVFLVNNDLKMGKGKIAAQVGHGAVALYRKIQKTEIEKKWLESAERKIVLKATLKDIFEIAKICEDKKIPYVIIKDGGLTQIKPGSITVLALIGDDEELKFTEKFKLL